MANVPDVPNLPTIPALSDHPEMPDLTVGDGMEPPPLPPWTNMKIPDPPEYAEVL